MGILWLWKALVSSYKCVDLRKHTPQAGQTKQGKGEKQWSNFHRNCPHTSKVALLSPNFRSQKEVPLVIGPCGTCANTPDLKHTETAACIKNKGKSRSLTVALVPWWPFLFSQKYKGHTAKQSSLCPISLTPWAPFVLTTGHYKWRQVTHFACLMKQSKVKTSQNIRITSTSLHPHPHKLTHTSPNGLRSGKWCGWRERERDEDESDDAHDDESSNSLNSNNRRQALAIFLMVAGDLCSETKTTAATNVETQMY